MVLKHYIRILSGTFVFMLMALLFSCEELGIINCSECSTLEPKEVYLEMTVTDVMGGSQISIYEGYLEDSVLFYRTMTYSKNTYYKVPLNKMYTITARYIIDGKTYIAVNSVTPRVEFEEKQCNEPCYYVYDSSVNLKLKYNK